MAAPDEMAWGAELDDLLKNGHFSYKQLIHYPHEGGSFFISLLALGLSPLKSLAFPLTLAALLVDTIVRYVQVRVTQRIFGEKAGVLFALLGWFYLPSLFPWAFVNFGLHASASVFPFLLLYFAFVYKDRERFAWYCGLLTGIAISYAFDNIVLIPACLLFLIISFRVHLVLAKKIFLYLGFTLLGLLPYLACRLFISQQFAFEPQRLFQGRDLIIDLQFSSEQFSHLYKVWYNNFPASFFINSSSWFSSRTYTIMAMAVMLVSVFLLIRDKKKQAIIALAALVVLCFTIAYSLSPLYEDSIEHTNYVDYRHFSYILPLACLLIVRAFLSLPRAGIFMSTCWIIVCAFFSIAYIKNTEPVQQPLYKPAGWILAKKYGDDPKKLTQIAEIKEKSVRDELMYGYGWGISTALLQNKKAPASEEIKKIKILLEQFPAADRKQVRDGIVFSFSERVTPRLDTAIYNRLVKEME
jgi:hypothetical protein